MDNKATELSESESVENKIHLAAAKSLRLLAVRHDKAR